MDILDLITQILTEKEKKEILRTIGPDAKSSKMRKLFQLISENNSEDLPEIPEKLYGKKGVDGNAYYMLRKRLKEKILQTIPMFMDASEDSGDGQILRTIRMAKFFARRKAEEVAIELLNEAEVDAELAHKHELLDTIYHLRLEYSLTGDQTLQALLKKWETNTRKLEQFRRLTAASAEIKEQVQLHREQGATVEANEIIGKVLEQYNLNLNTYYDNPEFMLRLCEIVRNTYKSIKAYDKIAQYIMPVYEHLINCNSFSGYNRNLENSFLFILAHTSYRNRDFTTASNWLERMKQSFEHNESFAIPYYTKYISMKAGVALFTDHIDDAIQFLKDHLAKPAVNISEEEKLNIEINTAVYHFLKGDFKTCNAIMLRLPYYSAKNNKKMGTEWYFKRELIDAIVQCELGNVDISDQRLKAIEERYHLMLQDPVYNRAKKFIGFMREYLNHPEKVTTPEFRERVRTSGIALPQESEDIQALIFFSWLLSKMQQKSCYEVLLKRIVEGKEEKNENE